MRVRAQPLMKRVQRATRGGQVRPSKLVDIRRFRTPYMIRSLSEFHLVPGFSILVDGLVEEWWPDVQGP